MSRKTPKEGRPQRRQTIFSANEQMLDCSGNTVDSEEETSLSATGLPLVDRVLQFLEHYPASSSSPAPASSLAQAC